MKKFFKFYFWLIVLLFSTAVWLDVTDGESLIIVDFFDYLFWVLAIIGIFGFCYSKKILNSIFWKLFLPFIILWDIYVIHYEIFNDPEIMSNEYGSSFIVFMVFLFLLISLPGYIVIYLYGYKNPRNT
jgi:hypothetical protein